MLSLHLAENWFYCFLYASSLQGSGGRNCHFYLYDNRKQRQLSTVSFELVPPQDSTASLCIGIAANGMSTIPSATNRDSDEAHFYVSVLQLVM